MLKSIRKQSDTHPTHITHPTHLTRPSTQIILVCLVGLALINITAYAIGLWNKPVAEDFNPADWYLHYYGADSHFRPLIGLTFVFLKAVGGAVAVAPFSYHLVSLLAHLLTTSGVFVFGSKLTRSWRLGLVMAALFAVYPRHHEPIFWSASLPHLYLVMFGMVAVVAHIKSNEGNRLLWRMCAAVFLVFAMCSAEAGIVFSVLIFAYEYFFGARTHERHPIKRWVKQLFLTVRAVWYLAVPVLFYIAMISIARGGLSSVAQAGSSGNFYRPALRLSQIQDLAGYITYTLHPFLPLRISAMNLRLVAFAVAIIICGLGVWRGGRLGRFGLAWMLISILPYLLLVLTGNADRYFYLASIGFCMLAVSLGQVLAKALAQRIRIAPNIIQGLLAAGVGLYVVAGILTIHARAQQWAASGQQFEVMLAKIHTALPTLTPNTQVIFLNLPQEYAGVRFTGTGIRSALRYKYELPELDVRETSELEVVEQITAADTNLKSPSGSARILEYQNGEFVDRSYATGSKALQKLLDEIPPFPP